jgi:hypothetical protein
LSACMHASAILLRQYCSAVRTCQVNSWAKPSTVYFEQKKKMQSFVVRTNEVTLKERF